MPDRRSSICTHWRPLDATGSRSRGRSPLPAGRAVAAGLGLTYPLLSEAPTAGLHPASSAYGVYHAPQPDAGPVDAFAAFVIDREGVIRWRRISPGRPVPMADVVGALREVAP